MWGVVFLLYLFVAGWAAVGGAGFEACFLIISDPCPAIADMASAPAANPRFLKVSFTPLPANKSLTTPAACGNTCLARGMRNLRIDEETPLPLC